MSRLEILITVILTVFCTGVSAQVKIRLFSNQSPESAVVSVTEGQYEVNLFNGEILTVLRDESVVIARFNGRLAVKKRNGNGFICDSLIFSGKTEMDSFSLMMNGSSHIRQYYSGNLQCFPDLGTLLFINIYDVEKYISGVVMAEGGSGKNLEYFKTQAIIARTYMYKYFNKHLADRYNVCDNTHCQAFTGVSSDTLLNIAVMKTKGQVILDKDSILIISTFHSNCGGETASSEDVWLSPQSYLKSIDDPYCLSSRNATWQKTFPLTEWVSYISKSGYIENVRDPSVFNFFQVSRLLDYKTGSFTIPLKTIRADLNLRSTFFSVYTNGDYIVFKGRGYGHGVGLCQEGAMEMGRKGFNDKQIIDFYYFGVLISDIGNAVDLH